MNRTIYYDNSAPTVNSASCMYSRLNHYNQGSPGMTPPVPATTKSGYYRVPTWEYRLSPDTLVMGGSCSGYANIIHAYGKNAGCCDPQYRDRPCGE